MPKTLPAVTYNEVNQSAVPPIALLGVHGVIAPTLCGQADKPYEMTSTQQFIDTFGSFGAASPYFAQIYRALSRGTTLWVQRLLATGATRATITLGASLVTATADDFGAWANGTLSINYVPTSVTPGTCQMSISYSGDSSRNEVWTAASFAALMAVVNTNSTLITLTGAAGFTEPLATAGVPIMLAGGTDGAFATPAAQDTAIQALFTNFDDSTVMPIDSLLSPASNTAAHYGNLATYVGNRQDIFGLFEIDPTLAPAAAATFVATLSNQYSQFMAVYYSSLETVYDATSGNTVSGGCLLDVAAVWAVSDTIADNVYLAPAGSRRGTIPNVKSFAYNLLAPANINKANALVSQGVNIVGNDPAFGPVVWGASTFYNSNTALDQINVRRSLTSLHQQLMPIFRSEEFQPMDPISWRDAYTKAQVVLDAMVDDEAIYAGYTYVGDQESSTIADATYNKAVDLANGLYKVLISIVPVGFISAINVTLDINNLLTLFNTSATVL